ncbi:MAG: cytochrome P450 [Hyphomonadaceae bacterium]|nr:cytochrome P450 [Hyphomonadaceae bacterium]
MSSIALAATHSPTPLPAPFTPPHIAPPARPLNRLAFIAKFVRNPLLVVPQAVYEQDVVRFPGRPVVWVTEPGLIKAVLLDQREQFRKLVQIRLLSPLLGKGILTSEGSEWKWQRQTSAPMFRHHELTTFVPTFVRATRDLLARWRQAPSGTTHDIEHDMTRVTFDVISATLLPSADATVGAAIERSARLFQKAGAWSQLYAVANAPPWLPQPGRRSQRQAVHMLRSSVAAMLHERRGAAHARDDLMHRLMQAHDPETGAPMTEEQLIDNLLTFYLAGHETTAKALTWTLYLLARSPAWAGVLKDEIARVTGGADVAAEHIDKLGLTQQVIKESMRIYPPVPMMSRQAVADTALGGHAITAGTSVVLPIYALHRHAARWPNPHLFDPERFAPEQEAKMSRYQYMPFGAGPRICIGMAFAMIEATAMLASMLQCARFATIAGHEPEPVARVTLAPRGGMPLRVWLE